jgi:hypothetical protein
MPILILTSHLRLCLPPSLFQVSDQNSVCFSRLTHACLMLHPSLPLWLDHLDHPNIWWSAQVMKALIMQPSPASRHFLSTLFSTTFNLCSPISVRYHFSHSYSTTGKIISLFILIFWVFRDETETQKNYEPNSNKHSPNLICSKIIHECNFHLDRSPSVLAGVCYSFPHCLQANSGIVPWNGIWPPPFQYLPAIHSWPSFLTLQRHWGLESVVKWRNNKWEPL